MQMHSSYVVTDPKGTVLIETGKMLQRGGYEIKVLNTIDFKKSMHYNPFVYIRSEKDILKFVTALIANTKGDGKTGDDFWQKAETLILEWRAENLPREKTAGFFFKMSPEENELFEQKMALTNIRNKSAFIRKMCIDGHVFRTGCGKTRNAAVRSRGRTMICSTASARASTTAAILPSVVSRRKLR